MAETKTVERGDRVPDFDVKTLGGDVFSYTTIWQQKNLVLVVLPAEGTDSAYASELSARTSEFHDGKSACIVTREPVAGVPAPSPLVADRWGEIVHVAAPAHVEDLPTVSELLEWIDYVEQRCPECEGEAK